MEHKNSVRLFILPGGYREKISGCMVGKLVSTWKEKLSLAIRVFMGAV